MGFSLANNTASSIAHTNASYVERDLNTSLERLSSGYKINKAADDASGMAIADSLRTQSLSLGQAIRNANDAIGIIQIADKAMDEQIKILDTIKVKAVQSAQDGQTTFTRSALQADITRLMEELDNISTTTTFNGKSLLAGAYSNARFQIGAYSNTTITASIAATSSDKIGQTRFETGKNITDPNVVKLKFKAVNGTDDVTIESVIISHTVGTGLGSLAEAINKNTNELQVRAFWTIKSTGKGPVGIKSATATENDIVGLTINDVKLGTLNDIVANDADGKFVAAINNLTDQLGVKASIDARGHLELTSTDGRGISITAESGLDVLGLEAKGVNKHTNYGRLSLVRNDARDIIITQSGVDDKDYYDEIGFGNTKETKASEATINLRAARGAFDVHKASAMGAHANTNTLLYDHTKVSGLQAGVTTFTGAQTVMDIADTAIRNLDKIRSDLGSVQIQLQATVNNIAVTRTNVKFSESQIRDADYAEESTNFKRGNILAQAGSYAIAQSSTMLQNISRLLQ